MITNLGKELRKLRIDLGITQAQMAKSIGISSGFLSSIETGKKPVPEKIFQSQYKQYLDDLEILILCKN